MGNFKHGGVIWNDSDFTIQFCVIGLIDNADKQEESKGLVCLYPGSVSTTGLNSPLRGKKIQVSAKSKGVFKKIYKIAVDQDDYPRLKINPDLSCRNLTKNQF